MKKSAFSLILTFFLLGSLFLHSPVLFAHTSLQTENDLEQQIKLNRIQHQQAQEDILVAKKVVEEKTMEYGVAVQNYKSNPNAFTKSALNYAEQRLSMSEFALDSKQARLVRIEQKFTELSEKQKLLISENVLNPQVTSSTSSDTQSHLVNQQLTSKEHTLSAAQQAPSAQKISSARTQNAFHDQNAFQDAVTSSEKSFTPPVLQGKITDPSSIDWILSNIRKQLNSPANNEFREESLKGDSAQRGKVFGTSISGEIPLIPISEHQFLARIPVKEGHVRLFLGARQGKHYIRTELDVHFSEEEADKPFLLMLDLKDASAPLALVFEEKTDHDRDQLANHIDF